MVNVKPHTSKHCAVCDKAFGVPPSRLRMRCCSKECGAIYVGRVRSERAQRTTRACLTCGTPFVRLVSQTKKAGTGQYCSRGCIPKPERVPRTCDHCGEYFTVKLSRLLIGKYTGQYCSLRCQRDSQKTPHGPAKNRPGIDTWRRAVLLRDGHACQECGATDRLTAHHVKPWAQYPELRYELSNGLTLCAACHFTLHYPDIANPYAA